MKKIFFILIFSFIFSTTLLFAETKKNIETAKIIASGKPFLVAKLFKTALINNGYYVNGEIITSDSEVDNFKQLCNCPLVNNIFLVRQEMLDKTTFVTVTRYSKFGEVAKNFKYKSPDDLISNVETVATLFRADDKKTGEVKKIEPEKIIEKPPTLIDQGYIWQEFKLTNELGYVDFDEVICPKDVKYCIFYDKDPYTLGSPVTKYTGYEATSKKDFSKSYWVHIDHASVAQIKAHTIPPPPPKDNVVLEDQKDQEDQQDK